MIQALFGAIHLKIWNEFSNSPDENDYQKEKPGGVPGLLGFTLRSSHT